MQFINTLHQILSARHETRLKLLFRYLLWQIQKVGALSTRKAEAVLSQSVIRDNATQGTISQIRIFGVYDYNNMNFIKEQLAPGGKFLDVGANIGAYSLIASECENASVVGIEPHPTTFSTFSDNVRYNRRQNVTCLNLAASDHAGDIIMTDLKASALNRVVDGCAPGNIAVECDTLDNICDRISFLPSAIKMDIEGHEIKAIAGAKRILSSADFIIIENGRRQEILDAMKAMSFSGPYYIDFDHKALRERPTRFHEDEVFVRQIPPGYRVAP